MTDYNIFHYLFGIRLFPMVVKYYIKIVENAEKSLIFCHFSMFK